jgi:hypothetical protein
MQPWTLDNKRFVLLWVIGVCGGDYRCDGYDVAPFDRDDFRGWAAFDLLASLLTLQWRDALVGRMAENLARTGPRPADCAFGTTKHTVAATVLGASHSCTAHLTGIEASAKAAAVVVTAHSFRGASNNTRSAADLSRKEKLPVTAATAVRTMALAGHPSLLAANVSVGAVALYRTAYVTLLAIVQLEAGLNGDQDKFRKQVLADVCG